MTTNNTVISPISWSAIPPKLCGNCAFPQNFHTRKLGEITVFYDVIDVQQGPKYTSAFEERTEAATGDVLEK